MAEKVFLGCGLHAYQSGEEFIIEYGNGLDAFHFDKEARDNLYKLLKSIYENEEISVLMDKWGKMVSEAK